MPVRHRLALLLLASLVLTTGCSGSAPSASPAPATRTPAPIETASDEAAFREAEATYRAYVDALNAVDLSDPATFEPVFALTTGELERESRASFAQMQEAGWRVTGRSMITLLQPQSREGLKTRLSVCLDVADVVVLDAADVVVTEPTRNPIQMLTIEITQNKGQASVSGVGTRSHEPGC